MKVLQCITVMVDDSPYSDAKYTETLKLVDMEHQFEIWIGPNAEREKFEFPKDEGDPFIAHLEARNAFEKQLLGYVY